MKQFLKSALTVILAAAMVIPALAACDSSDTNERTSGTTAAATTSAETAGVTTTAPVTEGTPNPDIDFTALLSTNVYAVAGLEQAENLVKRYYNSRSHMVKRSFSEGWDAEIWYVAAFLDAMSEAYRLYPESETIKNAYIDCLDNCLPGYRVTNATITPPSGERYRGITYYNAGKNSSGDFYFDDNAWICIAYLTAYELLGKDEYLTRAEEILEFLWTGYDNYQGGGIYWSSTWKKDREGNDSNKGTCTNAPSSICYLWTYMLTGKEEYLERGKLLYEWVRKYIECNNGVYHAGINDPWQPAYDQGTMMYATVLLYLIEGDDAYLKQAKTSYNGTVAHMFNVSGRRGEQTASMIRNRIYKSWCIGWLIRGFNMYYLVDSRHSTIFMQYMEMVLDQTLKTKDRNGQYDPFFCSSGTDFWDKSTYDNEVIQPAGMTSVLLLTAYFDVFLRGSNESLSE